MCFCGVVLCFTALYMMCFNLSLSVCVVVSVVALFCVCSPFLAPSFTILNVTMIKFTYPLLPNIHWFTFLNTIHSQPKFLVFAIYALAAKFLPRHQAMENAPHDDSTREDTFLSEEYFATAQSLIHDALKSPDIDVVRALLLMSLYASISDRSK